MGLARHLNAWGLWTVLAIGVLLGFLLANARGASADRSPSSEAAPLTNAVLPANAMPSANGAPAAGDALHTHAALPASDARLLGEVLQRVREAYVDPVDEHLLMRQAAHGLVAALDSHSTLLEPADFAQLQAATSGSYAGVGVEVDGAAEGLRVVRSIEGTPAARAGLRSGDLIVRIDGLEVGAANIDTAAAMLRGLPGSRVRLAVRRERASAELQFELERSQVELPSVAAESLAPGYGYLRIREFTAASAGEVSAAMEQLRAAARGRIRGLVIDLRDNPGGVLEAAGTIADDFLDHGTIVSADGRARDARFRMVATPGDLLEGAPIVVLVNGKSASAAEILAAALRQNGRALLLGERTYGKGTVQTIMPLSDGRALKLTTSRYYTPAGDSINGVGIVPDRVLGSAGQPPAAIDSAGRAPTLARRDAPVAVALAELRDTRDAHGASGAHPPRRY